MILMAGMIGTGKTTFAELISSRLGSEVYYESVGDNPILPDYYVDPKRWAFPLQIYFLNTRFKTIRQASKTQDNVLDRSLYEDLIFAELNHETGNMSKLEFETYKGLLETLMQECAPSSDKRPDLLIYLDSDLQTALSRIKNRGRDYEQVESHPELFDYYKILHEKYKEWIKQYTKTPVLIIDSTKYDLHDPLDAEKVLSQVKEKLLSLETVAV